MSGETKFVPGLGEVPTQPLERVWAAESKIAKELLNPFKSGPDEQCVVLHLVQQRADRLEQAICEAIVDAYKRGYNDRNTLGPGDYFFDTPERKW